jgi:spore germination protein KA
MVLNVDQFGNMKYDGLCLTGSLENDLKTLSGFFSNDITFQHRFVNNRTRSDLRCAVLFLDGMSETRTINESIIEPITSAMLSRKAASPQAIMETVVAGNSASETDDLRELVEAILSGDTVVLVDGFGSAIIVNTKGFAVRSISEPDDEKSLRGPREGFTESLMMNASMLRRKLQTSDLKFKSRTFGARSNTKAFLCYLDSVVDKHILAEFERRLDSITIDGVLDINYIQEQVKDSRRSVFKTCGNSEKPDVVAAKLLEGRIALILDGTPIVMTVPYLFIENLQAADDYYNSFYYGTIGRLLRILGFFITISAPAIYVSLIAFHPEMIPTGLMLSIAAAISKVPFPSVVECIGMLAVFEVLRETGIRTPNKIGQALSIVGALIVGQAAVEARIVSAPVVIVVALTGITGLMVPRLSGAVIIIRYLFVAAAACLGFYGYFLALIVLFLYLTGMESFGVDYTSQMFTNNPRKLSDIYIRAPIPDLDSRPLGLSRKMKG